MLLYGFVIHFDILKPAFSGLIEPSSYELITAVYLGRVLMYLISKFVRRREGLDLVPLPGIPAGHWTSIVIRRMPTKKMSDKDHAILGPASRTRGPVAQCPAPPNLQISEKSTGITSTPSFSKAFLTL